MYNKINGENSEGYPRGLYSKYTVNPDRHAEDDDQVDVDEEGKVLPEQGLLHGATVSAGLAVAGGTRTRLSPR